jgi:hypothetical protein
MRKGIAVTGAGHTIMENPMKPCILVVLSMVLTEASAQKKKKHRVPLTNNILVLRSGLGWHAVLLLFICCFYNGEVNEDLLICKPLPTLTTSSEIFVILKMKFLDRNVKIYAWMEPET